MSQSELSCRDFSLPYAQEPTRIIRVRCTRLAHAEGELPCVVVVHGFKGFLRWGFFPELQEHLARAGFMALALNLSGSGVGPDLESFSDDQAFFESTPSRDVEDLESVLEALASARIPGANLARLGLLGHSRGGGTAILHAERSRAYRALVTWASVAASNRFDAETLERWRIEKVLEVPNARLRKLHRMGIGWLEDVERNAPALDILAACSRAATPALLIHGDEDQAVPIADMQALLAAFPPGIAQSHRVLGAGHTFGCVHPWQGPTPEFEEALQCSLAFLGEQLGLDPVS